MSMFNQFSQGPLMGAAVGIGASLLGGASSMAGGSATAASAEAMREAAEKIEKRTDQYRKRVRKQTQRARRRSDRKHLNNVVDIDPYADLEFNRTAGPETFLDTALDVSQASFDSQTDQKRANLQFALGGADDTLRMAQMDYAALASGDTSGFEREVKASAFGALADAAGFPVGAFQNTSAKNLLNFRQIGTENALGITDFFARQGTVDPVDPINSMFQLAAFDQNENTRETQLSMFNRELDFNRARVNQSARLQKAGLGVGLETSILGVFAEMEGKALDTYADAYKFAAGAGGGEQLGQSQALGGMGEALGQIGQQITPVSSGGGGFLSGIFG